MIDRTASRFSAGVFVGRRFDLDSCRRREKCESHSVTERQQGWWAIVREGHEF